MTDTGEVLREESQIGLMSVREPPDVARRMAISRGITGRPARSLRRRPAQHDEAADRRRRATSAGSGCSVEGADIVRRRICRAPGSRWTGDVLEIRDRALAARRPPADPDVAPYLRPEPLIESDDPAIRAEAEAAVARRHGSAHGGRAPDARASTRMLDKKPTVSLPSAREVLRTKVGDCNEHTALYVAMARSIGLPARIAVGLAYTRGAFFYHAWPEVYIDEGRGRGFWLPVDPTFNQFPADATHVRLARGGLDKQAAILPLIGQIKMTIVDVELAPELRAGARRPRIRRRRAAADAVSRPHRHDVLVESRRPAR